MLTADTTPTLGALAGLVNVEQAERHRGELYAAGDALVHRVPARRFPCEGLEACLATGTIGPAAGWSAIRPLKPGSTPVGEAGLVTEQHIQSGGDQDCQGQNE